MRLGPVLCERAALCAAEQSCQPDEHALPGTLLTAALPRPAPQLYDNPQLASTYLAAFQVTGDAQLAGESRSSASCRARCSLLHVAARSRSAH